MKKNITEFEFGKIIEEIPACKIDCSMTRIYINDLSNDSIDYLYGLVRRLPAEQLQSYMVYWNDNVENLLDFFRKFGW